MPLRRARRTVPEGGTAHDAGKVYTWNEHRGPAAASRVFCHVPRPWDGQTVECAVCGLTVPARDGHPVMHRVGLRRTDTVPCVLGPEPPTPEFVCVHCGDVLWPDGTDWITRMHRSPYCRERYARNYPAQRHEPRPITLADLIRLGL